MAGRFPSAPRFPRWLKLTSIGLLAALAIAAVADEFSGHTLEAKLTVVLDQISATTPFSGFAALFTDVATEQWSFWSPDLVKNIVVNVFVFFMLFWALPYLLPLAVVVDVISALSHTSGWTQALAGSCCLIILIPTLSMYLVSVRAIWRKADGWTFHVWLCVVTVICIATWMLVTSVLLLLLKYVLILVLLVSSGLVALAAALGVLLGAFHAAMAAKDLVVTVRESEKASF